MDIDEAARAYFAELSQRTLRPFDVRKIARPLDEIPIAIYNRIQRERRAVLGEPLWLYLEMMIRVSRDTWRSARFLAKNRLDHGREIEFLYAVPPLTRTVLDTLLTVVFIFDDPQLNIRRYYAGAWRGRYEKHKRLISDHGSDVAWKTQLEKGAAEIAQIAKLAGITKEEQDSVDRKLAGVQDKEKDKLLVDRWPNPGKFGGKSFRVKDERRAAFLRHLNDWFYAALSSDSHLGFSGLERRGGMYAQPAAGFDLGRHHDDARTEFMSAMMAIYVALLSEVSCQLGFEHEKKRLRDDVWPHLNDLDAAGLYKERYAEWLR
jgi:hypothetical protein